MSEEAAINDKQLSSDTDTLRVLGNDAVKQKKYHQAILYYTNAIKLDDNNAALYSNRSLTYLKLNQYRLALEDALRAIELKPEWFKGYFRKAEVELAAEHYAEAYQSYEMASKHHLNGEQMDPTIQIALLKCQTKWLQDKTSDTMTPKWCSGIGLCLIIILFSLDFSFTKTTTNPFVMVTLLICLPVIGYLLGKAYRYMVKQRRLEYLMPVTNSSTGVSDEKILKESPLKTTNSRYTKSQARQRYKKGKSQ